MSENTVVIRVNLAGLAEGWDETCYAYVKPATVADRKLFRDELKRASKSSSSDTDDKFQTRIVEDHFVSGKVKELNPNTGEFVVADMDARHRAIHNVSDRLFMDIMGLDLDLKALGAALAPEIKPDDEPSTDPSSSEDSQPTSAPTPPTS